LGDPVDERAEAAPDLDERAVARPAVGRIVRWIEQAVNRTIAPAVAASAATGEGV